MQQNHRELSHSVVGCPPQSYPHQGSKGPWLPGNGTTPARSHDQQTCSTDLIEQVCALDKLWPKRVVAPVDFEIQSECLH